MSILRQLLLSVTIAIGVILLGTLALSVNAAREYLSGQLQVQSTDASVSLALSCRSRPTMTRCCRNCWCRRCSTAAISRWCA